MDNDHPSGAGRLRRGRRRLTQGTRRAVPDGSADWVVAARRPAEDGQLARNPHVLLVVQRLLPGAAGIDVG